MKEDNKYLFTYSFEPEGMLRLLVSRNLETRQVVDVLKKWIELKELEMAMKDCNKVVEIDDE